MNVAAAVQMTPKCIACTNAVSAASCSPVSPFVSATYRACSADISARSACLPADQRGTDFRAVSNGHDRSTYYDANHAACLTHSVGDGRSGTGLLQLEGTEQRTGDWPHDHADRQALHKEERFDPHERRGLIEEAITGDRQSRHEKRRDRDRTQRPLANHARS